MQHQFVLHIKKNENNKNKNTSNTRKRRRNESGTKCTRDKNVCWYIIDDVPHGFFSLFLSLVSFCSFASLHFSSPPLRFGFFNLFKLWYCAALRAATKTTITWYWTIASKTQTHAHTKWNSAACVVFPQHQFDTSRCVHRHYANISVHNSGLAKWSMLENKISTITVALVLGRFFFLLFSCFIISSNSSKKYKNGTKCFI